MPDAAQPPPPDLSVVIPIRNERDNLVPLHTSLRDAVDGLSLRYEVVFVDDGSTDGSLEVLETLHAQDEHVRVVLLQGHQGKAAAYGAGVRLSRGLRIATLDADLQDDPGEIPALFERLDRGPDGRLDLISGWRQDRADVASKTLASRLFNALVRRAAGISLHDVNCGLRVGERSVWESIPLYGDLHRFIPVLAHRAGYRIGEAVVRHHPRHAHASRYGPSRSWRGLLDLLALSTVDRFLDRPFHLFGGAGLVLAALGSGINAYVASIWLRFGHIQSRHPLLLLGILLTVLGVQFVCTGLLAELLTRRARPEPRIRRILD